MKLTIAMPSHNVGARVNINILNVCNMASPDIDVVIRDNSGNFEKRAFLAGIDRPHCRIMSVDECSGGENHRRLLDEVRSEFVFYVADDDYVNGCALTSLCAEVERVRGDAGVIGTTGFFIKEEAGDSQFVCFDRLDGTAPLSRFQGFLRKPCHSIFQYSPLRKSVLRDVWDFVATMPLYLSYADVLMNCMFLMHGRLTYCDRFLYHYINANWSGDDITVATDAHYFEQAGIDGSAARVNWLIAMFEGAQTIMSKYQAVHLPTAQRHELALCWTHMWFDWFQRNSWRQAAHTRFDAQSIALAAKWQNPTSINLPEILKDITAFFSLSSPELAQRYYDFWK